MSEGRPIGRSGRGALRALAAAVVAVAVGGCAQGQGQKKGGFLGEMAPRPLFPKASAARPEPGLRVRAPGVEVRVADADGATPAPDGRARDVQVGRVSESPERPARMGLFRSPETERSLDRPGPLN